MRAELDILKPSEVPAYLPDWDLEHKFIAIRQWIEGNFDRVNEFDISYWEYSNTEELSEQVLEDAQNTAELVKEAWGIFATVNEFEEIVRRLEPDEPIEWVPADHRIDLTPSDEDDEDEDDAVDLEKLQARSAHIREKLSEIIEILPDSLGHNNPPEEAMISARALKDVVANLEAFEKLEVDDLRGKKAWLVSLAESAKLISRAFFSYSGKKLDLFLDKASESAGDQLGKWGGRALVLVVTTQLLSSFSDDLLTLISSLN